jgi:hypothetical protein
VINDKKSLIIKELTYLCGRRQQVLLLSPS